MLPIGMKSQKKLPVRQHDDLGMLVASSGTGLALVILSFASFLIRQPLKIARLDAR